MRLNLHGVVGVESVQQVDEEEYEEKVKRPVTKVCALSELAAISFIPVGNKEACMIFCRQCVDDCFEVNAC